jgi:preprotein translocase SecE subunit
VSAVDEVKKYVDFSFFVAFVLFAWLGMKIVDSVWRLFQRLPNPELLADISLSTTLGVLVAAGVTAYLRWNPRIYTLVTECGVELKKTIWPNWDETKQSTLVVIGFTFVLGFILFFFDIFWRAVTGWIYP